MRNIPNKYKAAARLRPGGEFCVYYRSICKCRILSRIDDHAAATRMTRAQRVWAENDLSLVYAPPSGVPYRAS